MPLGQPIVIQQQIERIREPLQKMRERSPGLLASQCRAIGVGGGNGIGQDGFEARTVVEQIANPQPLLQDGPSP